MTNNTQPNIPLSKLHKEYRELYEPTSKMSKYDLKEIRKMIDDRMDLHDDCMPDPRLVDISSDAIKEVRQILSEMEEAEKLRQRRWEIEQIFYKHGICERCFCNKQTEHPYDECFYKS